MNRLANSSDLARELQRLLTACSEPNPSRQRMATELRALADRLGSVHVAMRGKGEVIESKQWRHKGTKATASLYGAVPWSGAPGDQEKDWRLESVGWTIRWEDGTIGIGRQPFKSKEEAEEWLEKFQAKKK